MNWFKRNRTDLRISDIQDCFKSKLSMIASVEKDLKRSQANYNDLKVVAAAPGRELIQKFLNSLSKQLTPSLNIHKTYTFDNILEFFVDSGRGKISIHNTISLFNTDNTMNYTLRDETIPKYTLKGTIPASANSVDIAKILVAGTIRFNAKFGSTIKWTL